MLHGMARRALTRERSVALIVGALIVLSVTLAATGIGLRARLTGASDALLERAHAPHLAQMHAGDLDPEQLGIDGADLQLGGRSQDGSIQQNSLVVPTLSATSSWIRTERWWTRSSPAPSGCPSTTRSSTTSSSAHSSPSPPPSAAACS